MALRTRGTGAASGSVLSAAAVLWGLVFAFGLSLAAGTVMGLVAHLSPWNASASLLKGAAYGCVALAGWLGARRAARAAWLNGGAVGALFFLVASWALIPGFNWTYALSVHGLAHLGMAFAAGAFGGMLGRLR